MFHLAVLNVLLMLMLINAHNPLRLPVPLLALVALVACHVFLQEKGPYTASYFPYSLFPFMDFLIDFYLIQPVCIKYIQIRRGT